MVPACRPLFSAAVVVDVVVVFGKFYFILSDAIEYTKFNAYLNCRGNLVNKVLFVVTIVAVARVRRRYC